MARTTLDAREATQADSDFRLVPRGQTVGMNSRVHPKYKTKYRVTNWESYDRALVRRGDITLWLSPEAVAAWKPGHIGRPGGQLKYSDLAIETALTLRLVLGLPLRQTEGFLTSYLRDDGARPFRAGTHDDLGRSKYLEVEHRRVRLALDATSQLQPNIDHILAHRQATS